MNGRKHGFRDIELMSADDASATSFQLRRFVRQ